MVETQRLRQLADLLDREGCADTLTARLVRAGQAIAGGDNVNVVAGLYTANVATDTVGGAEVQRIKPVWGTDGIGTDVSAAAPLPVIQTGALPALSAGSAVIGAVLQSGVWTTRIQDSTGGALGSTTGALDVHIKSTAVGSTVITENGVVTGGQNNIVPVVTMPYTFDPASGNWTRVGAATFYSADLDETEEDVKTTACRLYGYSWGNTTASVRYIHFWNGTAASVTPGVTPVAYSIMCPPSQTGHLWMGGDGPAFTTALSTGATSAFDGTGALAGVNEVILAVWTKP